jgi:hypothetical protein
MSDLRAAVVVDGINGEYATLAIDNSTITYDATKVGGSAQVGLAVTFSGVNTVGLVGDGEAVVGKLLKAESDNFALVQIGGGMTLPGGTSATLTVGKKIVGDLLVAAEGYIREVATATAAELGVARGFIVDGTTDTAAVAVIL